ncbi:MAG: hypothetical protein Kow0088_11290 [Anaerolineales bacterium]
MLDVYILPLSASQREDNIGGQADFLAFQTAKKVARQRRKELLLLHLHLQGTATLSAEKRALLMQRLSEVFYKTAGTTTGALRAVAESLNQFLFERNTRLENAENHSIAYLTQIVCQPNRLTIAQSGLSHLYRIASDGVEHLYDPDLAGKGLGSGKVAKVRFVQLPLQSADTFLVCVQPPATWRSALLTSLYGQDLDRYPSRLAPEKDVEAWALQFKTGVGKVIYLPSVSASASASVPAAEPSLSSQAKEEAKPPSPLIDSEKGSQSAAPTVTLPQGESTVTKIIEQKAGERESLSPAVSQEIPPEPSLAASGERLPPSDQVVKRVSRLNRLSQGIRDTSLHFVQRLGKLLPDQTVFQLPTSVMALIAIFTPLVVVALAASVYFRQGQVGEFERYLALAQQAAQQAQSVPNPLEQRSAWEATLAYLDRATAYSNSSEAQALRAQAYAAIDQLEAIQRLDYALAVDDLPKDAQIIKMAVTENELFLLDANSGVVWRATAAARGYILNAVASCGPGIQGAAVGKLVGFGITRKATQLQAIIVGVDAAGNVVTCDYDVAPLVTTLTPDERGMGSLSGFVIDRGNTFILDPQKNAVWIYWKNKYDAKPELFFSNDVPSMENVVDFAVYGEDLYLLYGDGHLAQCTYHAETPTRCVDPQPYKDTRPGRENQTLQSDTPFTRLYVSQPPDPALYLLEPNQAAIYQFSLRLLAFHSQLRSIPTPEYSVLPQGIPATALAVSSEQRLVFLAFGNRVYYANLP